MKTVVVTGGIGSGKTEFCKLLSARGIPVYDSDSRTKALYDGQSDLLDDMEDVLGCDLRNEDGGLDRKKLASIIFSDRSKLLAVEEIVHPAVLEDFRRWKAFAPDEVPFVVFESAIVLEKPLFRLIMDYVVLVDAPPEVRLKRACMRDGTSPEKVLERMSRQHFDLSLVDRIVRNDSGLESLEAEAEELFVYLTDKLPSNKLS